MSTLKLAYISSAFLADCDLPLLYELHRQGIEVHYFLQMSDTSRQATMINVHQLKKHGGVFSADEYRDLAHLSTWLPLDHIHVVNMPRPKDLDPQSLKAYWTLYKYLRKMEPDVIHVTSPLRYGAFLLYALRSRMVLTMHDPLPHSSDMGILNRVHRWVALLAVRHFVILSKSLKSDFESIYHIAPDHVHLSRLGIYTHLRNVTKSDLELPDRYILFAGSINPHKGIEYLCDAMAHVHKIDPTLQLVIAGRGNFYFDIDSYQQKGYIQVINRFVTDGELSTMITRSQFVCCPYKDATQSGVIMSSFALGKPVLATRTGALYEMVEDGRYGLLVPPCDSHALSDAIVKLTQRGTLHMMSQCIQEDFESGDRSWSSIADETIQIYEQIQKI